jgi:hypothetical protein
MFREISLFLNFLYYFLTGSHQAIKLRTHRDKILFSSKKNAVARATVSKISTTTQ